MSARSRPTCLARTRRGCVAARFRVEQIVYLGFSRDQAEMGFAFPKEWRPALVESEPEKFFLLRESELRWNWVCVRLEALDHE